jgi:integrase
MSRQRKYEKRASRQRPFDIDVIIPGLAAATGVHSDRFRCTAETRDPEILIERRSMVIDLGRRLMFNVLAARLKGQFTTDELSSSYKKGSAGLSQLIETVETAKLAALCDEWFQTSAVRSKRNYLTQVNAFIEYCGGREVATVRDLNTAKISQWLSSLHDLRRGNSGIRASSNTPDAIAARKRRAKKATTLARRPISSSTRNRYRAAISSFCTYLVNTDRLLKHPLAERRLRSLPEPPPRMPDEVTPEDWARYCNALATNIEAPSESVLVAKILRHSGADVGEIYGYITKDDKRPMKGILTGKVQLDRQVPRLMLKRHKVAGSPPRLVPIPTELGDEIAVYIRKHGLRPNQQLFRVENRPMFERAHERAVKCIDRPDLNLKDFRHLAAIAWARAGVRLERIKTWLGHSKISQTEVYARFAPDDDFDAPLVAEAARIAGFQRPPAVA